MTETDDSAIVDAVAAILCDWTPLPKLAPSFARRDALGWAIGGLYHGRQYVRHTAMRPDSPESPDDPIEAARHLDAHAKGRVGHPVADTALSAPIPAQTEEKAHDPQEPVAQGIVLPARDRDSFDGGDVSVGPDPADGHARGEPAGDDLRGMEAVGADETGGETGDGGEAQYGPEYLAATLEPRDTDDAIAAHAVEPDPATFAGTMVDQRRSEIARDIGAIARDRAKASEDYIRNADEGALNNRLMMGLATDADRAMSGELGRRKALVKRVYVHADALQRSLRDWPSDKLDEFDPNDPVNPWPS